jgi:predicted nucleic acid-binding Zn ribbon protein
VPHDATRKPRLHLVRPGPQQPQRKVASKTAPRVTRGVWGTEWKVDQELRNSPGLAFIRRYLSFFDYSELQWITLGRSLVRSGLYYKPYYGTCTHPGGTSSGLFRINCSVFADVRYPAEVRLGERDWSGKLLPFYFNAENEVVVAVIAHEVSHYLGSTAQVPANGKVDPHGIQSTSEAQANEFLRGAVEAYRRRDDALPGTLAAVGWCVVCGKPLSKGGGSHDFCSDRCRWTYHNRQRGARIAARRGKIECEVCGAEFTPARNDAKTCSPRCRQKKYRQVRKD